MNQIHNPAIPFNAPIPGGVHPGKMIKIHGSVPPTSHRFAVNLLCGHMGDIAMHIAFKFHDKHVVRNSVQNMHWGHEEKHGHMPIHHGQTFEMLILCDPHHFKLAFNNHHFCEFNHRISYTAITNLAIDGEVTIFSINFEGAHTGGSHVGGFVPPHQAAPPHYIPPGGHMSQPHIPHTGGVGIPSYPGHHNPIHHAGSPYPHSNPVYPLPPGHASQPSYPSTYPSTGQPYPSTGQSYPSATPYPSTGQPGVYPHSPQPHHKQGLLDKAGMAVAGVLGASALTGAAGGHKKAGKLGILGTALGATAAGAALTGHLHPAKAMKKQAKAHHKAQKKALKYGLPIAGVGLGAYALHKGLHGHHHHGHHRSSSSSSSSSSD